MKTQSPTKRSRIDKNTRNIDLSDDEPITEQTTEKKNLPNLTIEVCNNPNS